MVTIEQRGRAGRHPRLGAVLAATLLAGLPSLPTMAAGTGTRAQADWPLPVQDDTGSGQVMIERLELQAGEDEDVLLWDLQAWYGGDIDRVHIETEGEDVASGGEGGEIETFDVLYSRRIARFWDLQVGAGYQARYGPGPDRDRASAVIGFEGLAPYWFEVDAGLRVSEGGNTALEIEGEYDWRLSQRWILQARGETGYAFDAVERFGVGEGATGLTLGLRLRYHLTRELAPYVGVTGSEALGDSADLAEAAGEATTRSAVVAGIRLWF